MIRSLFPASGWLTAVWGLSVALTPPTVQAPAFAPARPNIIYILTDDLGYGDIGPFGQRVIQTPHLDRMAREGMTFTQHYSTGVCAPSRAALMTGKHPGNCEIRGNREHQPHGQLPLSAGAVTVAELLKKAGYRTGLIGKWGLGIENTSGDPLRQGFDSYYGYLCQVLAHNSYPEFLLRNGRREPLNNVVAYLPASHWSRGWGSTSSRKVDFANDRFTDEALRFLDRNRQHPFFLYLAYTVPHDNGEAPESERIEVPDLGLYADRTDWSPVERSYAALISRLDRDLGRLFAHLKQTGLDDRTLVIFASDNGAAPYGLSRFRSNGPLRGVKRDLYEGGIRVPMIARWPGQIPANTVSERPTALWDFLPTACELTGVRPPTGTDGRSFAAQLVGKALPGKTLPGNALPESPYLYFELHEGRASTGQAVRMGRWKAIRMHAPRRPTELYDLSVDVAERHDVAARFPDVVRQTELIMQREHTDDPRWPFPKTE